MSGSSGSDPVSKISGSDLDSVLDNAPGLDQSNDLSVLDGDDSSISADSPQDIWRD